MLADSAARPHGEAERLVDAKLRELLVALAGAPRGSLGHIKQVDETLKYLSRTLPSPIKRRSPQTTAANVARLTLLDVTQQGATGVVPDLLRRSLEIRGPSWSKLVLCLSSALDARVADSSDALQLRCFVRALVYTVSNETEIQNLLESARATKVVMDALYQQFQGESKGQLKATSMDDAVGFTLRERTGLTNTLFEFLLVSGPVRVPPGPQQDKQRNMVWTLAVDIAHSSFASAMLDQSRRRLDLVLSAALDASLRHNVPPASHKQLFEKCVVVLKQEMQASRAPGQRYLQFDRNLPPSSLQKAAMAMVKLAQRRASDEECILLAKSLGVLSDFPELRAMYYAKGIESVSDNPRKAVAYVTLNPRLRVPVARALVAKGHHLTAKRLLEAGGLDTSEVNHEAAAKEASDRLVSYARMPEDVTVRFITDGEILDDLVRGFLARTAREPQSIGLDSEWCPDKSGAEAPAQILQISVSLVEVWVLDLQSKKLVEHIDFDVALTQLFASASQCLGFGLASDLRVLRRSLPQLSCWSVLEDRAVTLQVDPGGALKDLTAQWLGKPLDKENQMSNWSMRPLADHQLHYAAMDAWVLLEIDRRRRAGPAAASRVAPSGDASAIP